jgi:RimJ/RimL family protein N-acetyltransferase
METERLLLKLYTPAEQEAFIALLTDERVMLYVDKGVMSPESAGALWRKLTDEWYPRGVDTIWAVFARDDGRYVGNASIRPMVEKQQNWEIGYYLRAEEWGKGFGTELAERLVRYGFEALGLEAVFATVDYENAPSRKILEKAGMSFYEELIDEQGPFCMYRVITQKRNEKKT